MKLRFADEDKLIVRNDHPVLVWRVRYTINLFKYEIYVRGTESEVRAYMESEMGHMGSYVACTNFEEDCINALHLPIYIAPQE